MLAHHSIESAASNCCTDKCLPVFFTLCILSCSHSAFLALLLACLSPGRSVSCIISPISATFLPFPSVSQFIPPRTHPPGHYLLPAGINLKHICPDRWQTQTPKCTRSWPRAGVWWSQVELNWRSILPHNPCTCAFHKNAKHTRACICSQTNSNIFTCRCPRQAHKAWWQLEGRAEGVREVAYDSDTKALVFSWRRLYHTLGCCCIGLPLSWGNHGNRLLGDSGVRVSRLESVGLQLLNTKRD